MGAVEQVANEIRRHAQDRGLRAGDRLPSERELAHALGVSRPTVREGLRRLTDHGLVRRRRGSGTYLAEVEPRALLEVRLLLEPRAAALAARAADAEARRALTAAAARLPALLDRPDEFAGLDAEIHQLLADASGNPVLAAILAGLRDPLAHSREVTAVDRVLRASTAAEVEQIVSAVRDGRARDAEAGMRRHLRSVARRLADGPAGDR